MSLFTGNQDTKKKKKKPFAQRRKEWLNQFDDDKTISPKILAKYKSMVSKLEDKNYLVIGYGSLLNQSDVWRTSPNLVSHKKGYISGWKRMFNMGSHLYGSYLNVEPCDYTKNMLVSILEVPVDDMPDLFIREINYKFILQDFTYEEKKENDGQDVHEALMVVGTSTINPYIHPQLNYLHLCMTGAINLDGQKGADNFLNTTYTNFGSLRSWLNSFSLEQIMRSYKYLPR